MALDEGGGDRGDDDHHDGVAIPAKWSRADRFAPYVLRDLDGREIDLAEGTTFVELTRRPR